MVEAISSLAPSRAQRQAQRQARAIIAMALFEAQREIKARLRNERRKLSQVPRRDIEAMARAMVMDDAEHRAKLIAKAKQIVEEWRVEGFFGKAAQNLAIQKAAMCKGFL
jgi:hypothetical protein